MAPAFVNHELRKGGNPPDPGKVRSAALQQAERINHHKMRRWVKVPTPIRGEEVWVCWCKYCGGALIWRSRLSIFSRRADGDTLTQVCMRNPENAGKNPPKKIRAKQ